MLAHNSGSVGLILSNYVGKPCLSSLLVFCIIIFVGENQKQLQTEILQAITEQMRQNCYGVHTFCTLFLLPELFNVNAVVAFAKENVETLMSVLDSVWSILKGNMSLAFYSFTALIGIVFGGGTAVLNFIVNMVC